MEKAEYNLNLYEALEIVTNGGAVKGNRFRNGVFLKLNSRGQLVIVDVANLHNESEKVYVGAIKNQKFRELSVMIMRELNK